MPVPSSALTKSPGMTVWPFCPNSRWDEGERRLVAGAEHVAAVEAVGDLHALAEHGPASASAITWPSSVRTYASSG